MSAILQASQLRVSDAGRVAVRDVSLTVEAGRCFALLGGPGSGKSALLEALAGLRPIERGALFWQGRPWHPSHPSEPSGGAVCLVHERPRLFLSLSPHENVLLGASDLPERVTRRLLRQLRAQLPALDRALRKPTARLDPADAHWIEIGRALVLRPLALLLDEPGNALDAGDLAALVALAKAETCAVLLAERRFNLALPLADQAGLLMAGKLVASGAPAAIAEHPLLASACFCEQIFP
ncbi:MAG: ATP-binding cassette domain-containing protein [Geminicoccaceae bacterium]